ncbi:MAG: hypothetical protein ACXQS9_00205 [Methermicoccaceae archaeon]
MMRRMLVVLTLLLAVLLFSGTACADKGELVWYGGVEVSNGDTVELAQGYSLHISDISGGRDGALFGLYLNDTRLADGIATSTSPYTYTVSRNDTEYVLLEVEGYAPKDESGRAGLRISQYADPAQKMPEMLLDGTVSLKVGKRHSLEQGYSLLATEYTSDDKKATIEVYSGNVRVGTYTPNEGDRFGYAVRRDSVHRCILFAAFDSAARFNESEPYVVILRHLVQYPDPSWRAAPTPTPTQSPAQGQLDMDVQVRAEQGDHLAAGANATVYVRVKEPLSSLGIYLDGQLVDSRENCSAPVYAAELFDLSQGKHTLTVRANATSGRWGIEQKELMVGTATTEQPATKQTRSTAPVEPPKVSGFSLAAGLCALLGAFLILMMGRRL